MRGPDPVTELTSSPVFVARNSPLKTAPLVLGAILFVVAGLWMVGLFGGTHPPLITVVGWVAIIFFGLCGIIGATRLFDRGEVIRIDANGIRYSRFSPDTILWQQVRAVSEFRIERQRFVGLQLTDPSAHRRASGLDAALSGANRFAGYGDVVLATTGTDARYDELSAIVRHYTGT